MMNLQHVRTFHGPNIFSSRPVVVASLSIEEASVDHIYDNISALLENLDRNLLNDPVDLEPGERGIAQFVIKLAVSLLNFERGNIKEQKIISTDTGLLLIVGHHHPGMSLAAMQLSADLVRNGRTYSRSEIDPKIENLLQRCRRYHPDYQAHLLMDFAESRDIPFLPFVPYTRFWQFGWGRRARSFFESMSDSDGSVAFLLSRDKTLSKGLFRSFGAPTPRHVLISEASEITEAAADIGFPCVVKPVSSGGGRGVSADVENEAELHTAFLTARRFSSKNVMVEQFLAGDDHRLMVVNGTLVWAVKRMASAVTGDGRTTIRQLIDGLNADRSDNPVTSNWLVPIKIDQALRQHLAKHGYDLDRVPPPGKRIALRANSNVSTGGIAIDVTDSVHPELRAMAEQLAESIGLYTAGLDYITTDISASPWDTQGAFIEINSTPGIDLSLAAGRPAEQTMEMIFGNTVGRIPARLFIADNHAGDPDDGDPAPRDAAIVSGNRLRIGHCTYKIARTDEWSAVQAALRNRTVQSLDIYASRQEVLSRGLPLDRFDKIVVNDPDFPEDWRAVLERCAGEVEIVNEPQRSPG